MRRNATFLMESEAILRLSVEISEAIDCDDAARAQRAQRELCQVRLFPFSGRFRLFPRRLEAFFKRFPSMFHVNFITFAWFQARFGLRNAELQLDKPSLACRHRIWEDCISASALLRLGERTSIRSRVNAVKKLGRWLRWPQAAKKEPLKPI